jgi:hypothetical protein
MTLVFFKGKDGLKDFVLDLDSIEAIEPDDKESCVVRMKSGRSVDIEMTVEALYDKIVLSVEAE